MYYKYLNIYKSIYYRDTNMNVFSVIESICILIITRIPMNIIDSKYSIEIQYYLA